KESILSGQIPPYPWQKAPAEPTDLLAQAPPSRTAPPARVFTVPGKDYALAVRQFYTEFLTYYTKRAPYAIARIFQIFPINIFQGGTRDLLIRRGSLHFSTDQVTNSGTAFDGIFRDRSLGSLQISFPENMVAAIKKLSDANLILDFSGAPVSITFFDIDA